MYVSVFNHKVLQTLRNADKCASVALFLSLLNLKADFRKWTTWKILGIMFSDSSKCDYHISSILIECCFQTFLCYQENKRFKWRCWITKIIRVYHRPVYVLFTRFFRIRLLIWFFPRHPDFPLLLCVSASSFLRLTPLIRFPVMFHAHFQPQSVWRC